VHEIFSSSIAVILPKQKGPGKTGAFDISELKTDQRE